MSKKYNSVRRSLGLGIEPRLNGRIPGVRMIKADRAKMLVNMDQSERNRLIRMPPLSFLDRERWFPWEPRK